MARPNQLTMCSFCGKSRAEVKKLIAGPGVYICDACVAVCQGVLAKELRSETHKEAQRLSVPKPVELKRRLDEHIIGQDEAKRSLAVAVYNHYKRIQNLPAPGTDDNEVELEIAPNVKVRLARSGIAEVRTRSEPVKDASKS